MKLGIAFLTLAAVAAGATADMCTQKQRQDVTALLNQDKFPTSVCVDKLSTPGDSSIDLTKVSTSRLCPIAECRLWLVNMTAAPDCVYDAQSTNFGKLFKSRALDCASPSTAGSSTGTTTTTTTTNHSAVDSSTSGSTGSATITKKPKVPTKHATTGSTSGSGSEGTTIEAPSITEATVGETDAPTQPTTGSSSSTLAPTTKAVKTSAAPAIKTMTAWTTTATAIVAAALAL